jgi:signal transduction histidine kinase
MRAVRELTTGLVHEVNNILGVIIGNAHLARKEPSDAVAVEKYVSEISAAAEEGRLLMQELALLAGGEPRWGRPIPINDAVANAAATLDVPVEVSLDSANPSVELHPSLAHDAFVDAMLFMAEAKDVSSIEVRTRANGSEVELVFEDDGPNPSKGDIEAMFTPFAKLDRRPKVGMRLVRLADLASRSAGHVVATARESGGLRVAITLPVVASGDGPGVTLTE